MSSSQKININKKVLSVGNVDDRLQKHTEDPLTFKFNMDCKTQYDPGQLRSIVNGILDEQDSTSIAGFIEDIYNDHSRKNETRLYFYDDSEANINEVCKRGWSNIETRLISSKRTNSLEAVKSSVGEVFSKHSRDTRVFVFNLDKTLYMNRINGGPKVTEFNPKAIKDRSIDSILVQDRKDNKGLTKGDLIDIGKLLLDIKKEGAFIYIATSGNKEMNIDVLSLCIELANDLESKNGPNLLERARVVDREGSMKLPNGYKEIPPSNIEWKIGMQLCFFKRSKETINVENSTWQVYKVIKLTPDDSNNVVSVIIENTTTKKLTKRNIKSMERWHNEKRFGVCVGGDGSDGNPLNSLFIIVGIPICLLLVAAYWNQVKRSPDLE